MSKAIRSYPKSEQRTVIVRRILNHAGGLGTLSAVKAANILAGRHIRNNGLTFEHTKTGVSINGTHYDSVEDFFVRSM